MPSYKLLYSNSRAPILDSGLADAKAGKSYKFKYLEHDVEVEVNSYIWPSFTVFVNGQESNTGQPRRQYWLRLSLLMLVVGWLVFGIAGAVLVVLASVVDQWMRIWRNVYWVIALVALIGLYFALVGTVVFIRALFIPPKPRASPQAPAAPANP